jgi:hypothetical protein
MHSHLAHAGEALLEKTFESLKNSAPPSLRNRVGKAVKRAIDDFADARQWMLKMGVQLPPADEPDVRWARYAGWLRVTP